MLQTYTYLLFALVTASLSLYFLLLLRLKPSVDEKLSTYMNKKPTQKKKGFMDSIKSLTTRKPESPAQPKEKACPHYEGYLTTLPKGSSFPEECFGCRVVIRCMRIEPTEVIESFYVAAGEPEL